MAVLTPLFEAGHEGTRSKYHHIPTARLPSLAVGRKLENIVESDESERRDGKFEESPH